MTAVQSRCGHVAAVVRDGKKYCKHCGLPWTIALAILRAK